MNSGIYCIYSIQQNMLYIGKSINVMNRKSKHLYDLRNNKHYNIYLQRSYIKYSEDNFIFSVLELIEDISELGKREKWWKEYVESLGYKTFNLAEVTENSFEHSEETKLKMSIFAKERGMPQTTIKAGHKANTGRKQSASQVKKRINNRKKSVIQIDQYTNTIIKTWNSIADASRNLNISTSNIFSVLRGKTKSAGGFWWKYNDTETD